MERSPFLYQAMDGTVYHINQKGVQVIRSWSSEEEIVAFVDGNKDYEPDFILFHSKVQIVLASSPKGANQRWMPVKQIGRVKVLQLNYGRAASFISWVCQSLRVASFNTALD